MNKIFISYNFKDKAEVKKIKNFLKKECNQFVSKIYLFEKIHDKNWKSKVSKKLRRCDVLILIVGENTYLSENILWEIDFAKNNNLKIIAVQLGTEYKIPALLEKSDTIVIPNENRKIKEAIKKVFDLDDEFIEKQLINSIENKSYLYEQYKLMVETSERLVERRSKTNTFFLSANGLLMTALGLLTKSGIENKYSFVYLILIALVGIILCFSWRSLLISYGQLNAGKFKIILILEKYLPSSIFNAEWKSLAEGKNKKIYKSFTASEKNVPLIILFVYIIYIIFILIFSLTQTTTERSLIWPTTYL